MRNTFVHICNRWDGAVWFGRSEVLPKANVSNMCRVSPKSSKEMLQTSANIEKNINFGRNGLFSRTLLILVSHWKETSKFKCIKSPWKSNVKRNQIEPHVLIQMKIRLIIQFFFFKYSCIICIATLHFTQYSFFLFFFFYQPNFYSENKWY